MKISRKILFITFFILCISVNFTYARTGKVKIEAARVRQEANTTSTIVTIIYNGDEVEILDESGDWYKIKYKDDTGFIKKDFLTETNTTTTNSVSNTTNKNQTNTTSNATNKNQTNAVNTANTSNTTNTTNNTSKSENIATTNTTAQNTTVANTTVEVPVDENTLVITSETYMKLVPSFSSSNVVKLEVSKQVQKLAELNNWIKVSDNENTGWILKNKVQTGAQAASTTETTKPENTVAQNTVANTANTVTNKTNTTNTSNTTNTTNTTATNTVANTTTSNSSSKKGVITVETAILRKEPTTKSESISFLDYGDEVTILGQEGEWYKISFKDLTGYVKNTLLKVSDSSSVSSRSLTEERQEKTVSEVSVSKASEVADYAKHYLGCSYVVGGKDPNSGFDCSGFTKYVYAHFGYTLGSTAASQNNIGTEVTRENLQTGDLILFLDEGKTKIGHTGVYIGGGEFVHAANPQRGVVTDNLNTNSYYNERFVTARRIVN